MTGHENEYYVADYNLPPADLLKPTEQSNTNSIYLYDLISNSEFVRQKSLLSVAIGTDTNGRIVFCDIEKAPHLQIFGTSGTGKSICMHSILLSILYRAKPDEIKFLLIDPTKVEFGKYSKVAHLLVPVIADSQKAVVALRWAISEMLKRYQTFSDAGVRDIDSYNQYARRHDELDKLPKIVICIDSLEFLMLEVRQEIEDSICKIAQMGRATGMHLIIATQNKRLIKNVHIPASIELKIADCSEKENTSDYNRLLYTPAGMKKTMQLHSCNIQDKEIVCVCDYIKSQCENSYTDLIHDKDTSPFRYDKSEYQLDSLFDKAVEVALENRTASTSLLQRKLAVGYARAAKIMDELENMHIIGPQDGARPRTILITYQQWLEKNIDPAKAE